MLALGVSAIFVFAACAGAATPAPATAPPATTAPATAAPATAAPATAAPATAAPATSAPATEAPASEAPASEAPASEAPPSVAPTPYPSPIAKPPTPAAGVAVYPDPTAYGTVDCEKATFNGLPYSGNLKSMTATDDHTVVFDFCAPDVAFLSQIAFDSLAIDDSQYLIDHMGDQSLLKLPNGTGPFTRGVWDLGNRMDFIRNDDYWGTKAKSPGLEFLWAKDSAARLLALQSPDSGVDGVDNPGKDDLPIIQGDPNLVFYPRPGLNTMYVGMNSNYKPWDDVKVRQAIAMGIDRQELVDKFYPPGSEVATYFTPCAIPFACEGDKYYDYDPEGAKALLAEAGYPDGFDTKIQFRTAVRGYNPDPPTIGQALADQLKKIGVNATIDIQESGTLLDNSSAGKLDGLFVLGWGADFPDASNFLDYHFGPGTGKKFGNPDSYPDLVAAIKAGGQTADGAERTAHYKDANNLIKSLVPAVFVAHGGSGTAFKKDVEGGYASPLQESFAGMKAGDRDTVVFMQNAEPLSLYCGDETDGETLRACHQIKEPLYTYGGDSGLDPVPLLAKACTPNDTLTQWTCTLQEGVKFQDGSDFAADDVINSFALQWDTLNPLHIGRTGVFEYWASLIGQGYLNPPKPS